MKKYDNSVLGDRINFILGG